MSQFGLVEVWLRYKLRSIVVGSIVAITANPAM